MQAQASKTDLVNAVAEMNRRLEPIHLTVNSANLADPEQCALVRRLAQFGRKANLTVTVRGDDPTPLLATVGGDPVIRDALLHMPHFTYEAHASK